MNSDLCESRSTSTYTNKYYVDYANQKCAKDCDDCDSTLTDLSAKLWDSAELCCSNMLGWLDTALCIASSGNAQCLEAQMRSSNGNTYPNTDGYVNICFDGKLSETSGTMQMRVENLKASTTGGVHIHTGKPSLEHC